MNKGCRDAQIAVFFSSFMKPGKEWGWNGCSVGGWRSFCWWLAELLLVVGGASVCDWWSFCWRKNKAFV
ncbi:MAG: hypothetical protein E6796_21570 [Bacteroides sp.]|uniref:hypothetical protein n=2 Tax=Bacteroides TaxID=816 RepID=UPI0001DAA6B3|nr:hypothetical protein [Bacteroides sp.]EFI41107.1 hypothetical protein HMPREF9010_02212 [Bacteroides sp. 3_1_23]MDU1770880.1 hypothetical protein [Bacteroides sp.]